MTNSALNGTTVRLPSAFDLTGRTAVITGAAGGIGQATAVQMGASGVSVICGDIDLEGAAATAAMITEWGGTAIAKLVDVSDRESVEALYQEALDASGRLDIAVHAAGILRYRDALELTEEEYDTVLGVNLKGVFFCCQSAGRRMSQGGSIINLASSAVDVLVKSMTTYAVTKGGVLQLTRTFAHDLGARKIRVNAIAPGWIETPMTQVHYRDENGIIDEVRRAEVIALRAAPSPLGITGVPEDIAYTALFLASDATRFCTGQVLRINGGIHMV